MGVKNHQKLLVTTGLTALAMFVLSFSSFAKGEYIIGIIGGVLFFALLPFSPTQSINGFTKRTRKLKRRFIKGIVEYHTKSEEHRGLLYHIKATRKKKNFKGYL